MNSQHVIRTNRPMKGLVAFLSGLPVTAAMGSLGAGEAAVHHGYSTSLRFSSAFGVEQLDRREDRMHPGEGSA